MLACAVDPPFRLGLELDGRSSGGAHLNRSSRTHYSNSSELSVSYVVIRCYECCYIILVYIYIEAFFVIVVII